MGKKPPAAFAGMPRTSRGDGPLGSNSRVRGMQTRDGEHGRE